MNIQNIFLLNKCFLTNKHKATIYYQLFAEQAPVFYIEKNSQRSKLQILILVDCIPCKYDPTPEGSLLLACSIYCFPFAISIYPQSLFCRAWCSIGSLTLSQLSNWQPQWKHWTSAFSGEPEKDRLSNAYNFFEFIGRKTNPSFVFQTNMFWWWIQVH